MNVPIGVDPEVFSHRMVVLLLVASPIVVIVFQGVFPALELVLVQRLGNTNVVVHSPLRHTGISRSVSLSFADKLASQSRLS